MKKLMKQYGLKRMGGKRKGFTLIELLIVLTILAILVAVVTISLTQFVGTGEKTACETDQRTLQGSVVAYYNEASAWPQTGGAGDSEVILYTASYDSDNDGDVDADDASFAPDFVIEQPESQTDCTWSVSDDGLVYVPDAKVGTDVDDCPCCEADTDHSWCGTP